MSKPNSSDILKATLISALDTFGVRGIRFVVGIILARILTPAEIGIIAMTYIFIDVSSVLSNGGFQSALIQQKSLDNAKLNSVLYFNIAIGALMTTLLYLLAPAIAQFFDTPELEEVIQLLSLVPLFNSMSVVQVAIFMRALKMGTLAAANFFATIISALVCIYMASNGFSYWSLAAQQLVYVAIYSSIVWVATEFRPALIFSIRELQSMGKFASNLLISELINKTFLNIYTAVIGKNYTPTELGYYARADGLQKFPSQSLSAIVARIAFPVLSREQDNKEKFISSAGSMIAAVCFLCFPTMTYLGLASETLIPFLLTEKWTPSIIFFQLLCIYGSLLPIIRINTDILQALGKSGTILKLELLSKAFIIVILAITFNKGIVYIIAGQIVSYSLTLSAYLYCVNVYSGISIRSQLGIIFKYLAMSAIAIFFADTTLKRISDLNDFWFLILYLILNFAFYIALMVLVKDKITFLLLSRLRALLNFSEKADDH